ncbi:MAG TPA: amino acid permease [Ruminiclostridium sp.]|nr:amino acid permease [Ruminiclostridium sp.]
MKEIFLVKPISDLIKETHSEKSLKKVLSAFELIMFGIGAIVGTGIFVITGIAAANFSGPALFLSFVLAGIVCILAALTYAEFASIVPVSGSAYTYSYVSLGEIWAWIIGWDLILEYTVAIGSVAIGWSGYITQLLSNIGLVLPPQLVNPPLSGGIVNLPAIIIIFLITCFLIAGASQSAKLNNIIVAIKIGVILLFIILAAGHIKPVNWHPFMPFGWNGVIRGAAFVFYAFLGFDAVSTAAEEVKNPQRDLPKGIIGSLIICTVLYIIVSVILTGIVPYYKFKGSSAPVAFALEQIGINWGSALISLGAVCGITSVLLVMTYGGTRIIFAMARDGLLPEHLGRVNARTKTPILSTIIVGASTAFIAGFFPIDIVSELTNIGTLMAFVIVAIGIIVLREKKPDLERKFKCPWVPFLPVISALSCIWLALQLNNVTKLRFLIWLVIGLIIYFAYGRKHSILNHTSGRDAGQSL